ncbi:aminotransferase class IV [Lamprobacter modestohalophilus]|uniref:aminotransferase class IV n=1 Tax=Lamprobacter modestohalophilus TaxID=1064514 RepID=UPI002ADEF2CF|nr:aminotransferase class IV [Lamprobacter modestohalophilus]MEA1050820.1 aminotransferase class IV [Lamprobacter modestohalophilus]
MKELYLNGAFVAPEQAMISVMDRGFLFGDGVYEVIPAYAGRPLRELEHLERLQNSLQGIGLAPPLSPSDWSPIFLRLLSETPTADQALYLQVTRGVAPSRDHRFPNAPVPTVLAMAKPMKQRDPAVAERGVEAVTRDDIRWLRCDIKATALLAAVLLRQSAEEAGAEEAILVRNGLALEGSTSNLFIVRQGRLITPPKGPLLLAGITRDLVLELAAVAKIPCEERDITAEELRTADEVWISSSTREVIPVTRLDGVPIGSGRPGPEWQRIDRCYQDFKADLRRVAA